MLVQALAFYVFAAILVSSALMVITAKNPVHSVLFLILGFFSAAGLFVLLGAEFIAMILVIVYVGAVAVLFLFVVMMLEIDFEDLRKDSMQYVPIGVAIGGILLFELITLYTYWQFAPTAIQNTALPIESFGETQNAHALGLVLYTDYIFAFQMSGLILFVAMIGAIVLTHRTRPGIRKQDIANQHNRKPSDAMEIHKVTPGTGA
ncbi:MAG: NADH-quinone oxidoreductase subunit J [Alphaproteobacteria bacterium]|nr:NADH-quinone oxidoreductase subunit J [Alphaproteobacteria bacterium]